MNANAKLLELFLAKHFPQFECPQCEFTFLTKVYLPDSPTAAEQLSLLAQALLPAAPADSRYVILEKHALGLEYFMDAIRRFPVHHAPHVHRVAVLSEAGEVLDESMIQLSSDAEPDYRIIYLMERLEHLNAQDVAFFNEHIHELDWQNEGERHQCLTWLGEFYGASLESDVRLLCRYFRERQQFIKWDLHGENLMRRPGTGELVILDPYTLNY